MALVSRLAPKYVLRHAHREFAEEYGLMVAMSRSDNLPKASHLNTRTGQQHTVPL